MCILFVKMINLTLLSSIKQLLLKFVHIFGGLYHLPISLILCAPFLTGASGYDQVEINYTLNYFFRKQTFLKMAIQKILLVF